MSSRFQIDEYRKKISDALLLTGTEKEMVLKALDFAYEAHDGQTRKSGEPYIIHPCTVVEILMFELGLHSPEILAAAYLHDVVEDLDDITIDQIESLFGQKVSEIVDGCTKLRRFRMPSQTLKDLTHSKIFRKASECPEIFLVKLADRTHNLKTLGSLPPPKRQRIAKETLDIYAPIAAILNLLPLRKLLFDLAIAYLFPKRTRQIRKDIKKELEADNIQTIRKTLEQAFKKEGMGVTIEVNSKSMEAFYNSVKNSLAINNAENMIDFTIIVHTDNVLDCYKALGVVNCEFRPVPRKLRDFIANPKPNGYQSIHARHNIFGKNFLMIIRTKRMDDLAKLGILAHWQKDNQISDTYIEYIQEEFRQIAEYGGEAVDRQQIIHDSKAKEIYLFTPKGMPVCLPSDSIVLDFAYKIHSDIGKNCIGAMVDGKELAVDDILSDGQVVTILTGLSLEERPPELESKCKTPKARSAMNRQKIQRINAFSEKIGREILIQHMEKIHLDVELLMAHETVLILDILNVDSIQNAYQRIGQDRLSPKELLYYLADIFLKGNPGIRKDKESLGTICVDALDNHFYKFAQCCNPYPGDQNIIGLLSKRGLSFHYKDCLEIERLKIPKEKYIHIKWVSCEWPSTVFSVEIKKTSVRDVVCALSTVEGPFSIIKIQEVLRGQRLSTLFHFEVNCLDVARHVFQALPKGMITIHQYNVRQVPYN